MSDGRDEVREAGLARDDHFARPAATPCASAAAAAAAAAEIVIGHGTVVVVIQLLLLLVVRRLEGDGRGGGATLTLKVSNKTNLANSKILFVCPLQVQISTY